MRRMLWRRSTSASMTMMILRQALVQVRVCVRVVLLAEAVQRQLEQ
jgi:hypothetical protein